MEDTKFSDLDPVTAVASPDFVAVVQGGVSKRADVSLFGGSFLSSNVARVDPSGSDGTGAVGDLNKPFLTIQGAISAIEVGSFDNPVIDIGGYSTTETLTTSLRLLTIRSDSRGASSFQDITFTASFGFIFAFFENCAITGNISQTNNRTLNLFFTNSSFFGATITGNAQLNINADSISEITGEINTAAFLGVTIRGCISPIGQVNVNAPNCGVVVEGSYLQDVLAATTLTLIDSRVKGTNSADSTVYADVLLTNIVFPDSDPHIAGAGYWLAGVLTRSSG